jgi:hypothetical protein
LAEAIREATRSGNSIIYFPKICELWSGLPETGKSVLISSLESIPPSQGTLLIATNDKQQQIPLQLSKLFDRPWKDRFTVELPNEEQRRNYFEKIKNRCLEPEVNFAAEAESILRPIDFEIDETGNQKMTKDQNNQLEQKEEATMRTLRIFLRNIVTRLAQDKRFKEFTKPVDEEEIPDYYDIIENPMDLSIIMVNIDEHHYETVEDCLNDINLIVDNTLEYNPDNYHEERMIRHRACLLKDFAHEMVERELEPQFEKTCQEIKISRAIRGANKKKFAPQYLDVEEEEISVKEKEIIQNQLLARSKASNLTEGELYWVLYKELFQLSKMIKLKPEDNQYCVQLLNIQKLQWVSNDELRNVAETDDINSVLKSPTVKKKQKKRKRSSWASGVIKKPKRKIEEINSKENEIENEIESTNINSTTANNTQIETELKDEIKMENCSTLTMAPVKSPEINGEDSLHQEIDTMELEKDLNESSNDSKVSNDSNKENKFPNSNLDSPKLNSANQQKSLSLFESNTITDSPGKRLTRSAIKEQSERSGSTSKCPTGSSKISTEATSSTKQVRIASTNSTPGRSRIALNELWTEEELQIAKIESLKIVSKIIIDADKLNSIFVSIVEKTENWNVEKIIEFGAHLNSIIYKYRHESDRINLCCELENCLVEII